MIIGTYYMLTNENSIEIKCKKYQRIWNLKKVKDKVFYCYSFHFKSKEEIDELIYMLKKFKKEYETNYEGNS